MSVKRMTLAVGIVMVVVAFAVPAWAVPQPGPPPGTTRSGTNTEMVMSGTGPGGSVDGSLGPVGSVSDPSAPYPAAPPAGFASHPEGFAGVIFGSPTDGSDTLSLYCIDIRTSTWGGIGYALGTWDASNVHNVGFVAYLLDRYYPNTSEPAALTDVNQRAAAVQAAIWYFSDNYVLDPNDGLRPAVAAIVEDARTNGPLVQPLPPSLTITPSIQSGPAGAPVGPFVVNAAATVVATGAMWGDATATTPIANGAPVPAGKNIWLTQTADGPPSAALLATATATVPTGNVYLYDGNTAGVNDAQRLILASEATLKTTVAAQADFQPPGSLLVTKTIGGPLAGQQGPIVITVACNGKILLPLFAIPAGTPPGGTLSQTYTNIPAGSICSVTETLDGHTADVTVVKPRSGQLVTIPSGGTARADLTDTYDAGSLVVNKTITGTAAGQQGAVGIGVVCNGAALAPFEIPAGTVAGTVSQSYDNIPAGSVCTVTETANGGSASVVVSSEGSPQNVTIAANGSGTADLTDTYELARGALVVTKTLAGSAAGQQGLIAIGISCGGPPNVFAFLIAPGTPAGPNARAIAGIPAGTDCVVAEVVDGSTDAIGAVATNGRQTVTVPVGGVARAALTNTFEPLQVTTTAAEELPATGGGSDARGIVIAAGLALAAGAALIVTSRRRTTSR
jgi:LPXTG-motif cell wall-anchored protein